MFTIKPPSTFTQVSKLRQWIINFSELVFASNECNPLFNFSLFLQEKSKINKNDWKQSDRYTRVDKSFWNLVARQISWDLLIAFRRIVVTHAEPAQHKSSQPFLRCITNFRFVEMKYDETEK